MIFADQPRRRNREVGPTESEHGDIAVDLLWIYGRSLNVLMAHVHRPTGVYSMSSGVEVLELRCGRG